MTDIAFKTEEVDPDGVSGIDQLDRPDLVDWDWTPDDLDISTDQDLIQCVDGTCVLSDESGDIIDYLPVVNVGDEEDILCTPGISKESIALALRDLPDPRKERAKALKQARLRVISEDDYDDPVQRKLVRLMRLRVEAILKGKSDAQEYLRWYFSIPSATEDIKKNISDHHQSDLEFESCAIFLGADPQAVRLKLQSYLYRYWVVLNEPIDFFVTPPPEEIISQGIYYAGPYSEYIIKSTWEWPGITINTLIKEAEKYNIKEKIAKSVIELLLESRIMLENINNCYVVGHYGRLLEKKNPWR